jgi:fucose permease
MGLAGNAILPLVYGHFADVAGHRQAYWILLPCYLYLMYYAFFGHRIRRWNLKKQEEKPVIALD